VPHPWRSFTATWVGKYTLTQPALAVAVAVAVAVAFLVVIPEGDLLLPLLAILTSKSTVAPVPLAFAI
jgi:hypothetical protein